MLTADLVRVQRRGGELRIVPLVGGKDEGPAARALELATALLQIARDHVGRTREEVEEALGQVECAPRERLVRDGLRKLIEDRCEFDVLQGVVPEEVRSQVFLRAAALRTSDEGVAGLPRDRVIAEIAAARDLTPAQLESALYADLRGAHVLMAASAARAEDLVGGYDMAQAQAVLLRAVRVYADVRCASPFAYRLLFRKLKFLRLLCTITRTEAGYHIEIDGPFSLFESVTKYGLQLALLLPAIAGCQHFRLRADVRWGKDRQPLLFQLAGGTQEATTQDGEGVPLPDEVGALLRGFRALESPWKVRLSQSILHLPGVGVCVPDLVFEHPESGRKVYLEVMGYWSRDAVWRRVELVQKGLPEPILFAVSERLRVSEQVLDPELPAALYVYKGTINPRIVADRLEQLSGRART